MALFAQSSASTTDVISDSRPDRQRAGTHAGFPSLPGVCLPVCLSACTVLCAFCAAGLALVACLVCFPLGFAAVIYAVLANVERAHMVSADVATKEPHVPAHGVLVEGGQGVGGGAEGGSHRGSLLPHMPHVPHPHAHTLPSDASPLDTKEKPVEVHRRRMGRLNRYACLLATAGLISGFCVLVAGGIFLIYYFARTQCPLCGRQTWHD